MKKRIMIFGLIAVLILSTSVMAFAATNNKTSKGEKEDDLTNVVVSVTEQDAVKTALNSVQNASLVKKELEDEDGVIVYGVEVNDGNRLHDIKVDANTGVILKDDIGSDADEKEEADADGNDDAIINADVNLSQEEAVQVATQSVDAAAKFVKAELEDENGVIVYGVEFTLNGKELDVKVDANTGTILAIDQDEDQDNDQIEHENDNEDEDGHED